MRLPSQGRADRETPESVAGADGPRPRRYRSRDLRIDATPEEVAKAIGAGLPKTAREWNYLKRKPTQSDTEAHPQRRSKRGVKQAG